MTGIATPNLAADPTVVIDLIEAFRRSKTMFTAVGFGIFDLLHEKPASAAELAGRIPADSSALEILLDGCLNLGLLSKSGGRYHNTPAADLYLRKRSPETLAGYILYSDRILYPMWGNLASAVRDGSNRWEQTFGGKGALFSNFFANEETKREFLAGMHGFGLLSSPSVVAAFDLSPYSRMVDLGGATGHLVLAALDRCPGLRGAVFDLPAVTSFSQEYLGGRAGVIAGDFFADPLPEADLYSLGRILHDWSDQSCWVLLKKIHAALPANGALLIAEKLLDGDKSGPRHALMQSLNMLVCTEGKERTFSEYTALLKDAGFSDVRAKKTSTPLDAVLAVK